MLYIMSLSDSDLILRSSSSLVTYLIQLPLPNRSGSPLPRSYATSQLVPDRQSRHPFKNDTHGFLTIYLSICECLSLPLKMNRGKDTEVAGECREMNDIKMLFAAFR